MSTISTGVGLVSGIPIQQLVDSLIAVQRQPITLLEGRLQGLSARRTAYLQLTSQLLSIQNTATRLANAEFFRRSKAATNRDQALVATAHAGAPPGQYQFTVRSLASTHQVVTGAFASAQSLVGAGTVTIEKAAAMLDRPLGLDSLRGGQGVQRGRFRITDRAGGSADIDITAASTIRDVVELINGQTAARVRAAVEDGRLALHDETGSVAGVLSVTELGGGRTAADLGILGSTTGGALQGEDLVYLSDDTSLSVLNDGNGVRVLKGQKDISVTLADGTALEFDLSDRLSDSTPLALLNRGAGVPAGVIKVTNRAGQEADVDLTGAQTIGDVKTAIQAAGIQISVTYNGAGLQLIDASSGGGSLSVADVSGEAAEALGIKSSTTGATLSGGNVLFVETIGDLRRLIHTHLDNNGKLIAEITPDGRGLRLSDATSGSDTFAVHAVNGSLAGEDLGLVGPGATTSGSTVDSRRLLAGLNTVLLRSLNGGAGIGAGTIQITNRAGASAAIALSGAETLADVLGLIGASAAGISASVSDSGLGIVLRDESGGAGPLVIEDISGTAAADLGIAVNADVGSVSGGNLQRQYISAATRLADMNDGAGIIRGKFRITDSLGHSAVVDLTQGNEITIQDVIDEINSRGIGVSARVNDTGDGLLVADTAGGGGRLRIAEEGGGTAKSLNILGEAAEGANALDGSFEKRITISATDTVESFVSKLKAVQAPVQATILTGGSGGLSVRVSLTSTQTGLRGQLALDGGTTNLSFTTLSAARDATVIYGDPNAAAPIVLQSATNTMSGVVEGLRLDLVGVHDQPVTVTVTRDVDAVVQDVSAFVTALNSLLSAIDQLSSFDAESGQRGVLNGDNTARRIRERLLSLVSRSAGDASGFQRIGQLGVTTASGGSLRLDETRLRDAIAADYDGVVGFFTAAERGFGFALQNEIKSLTDAQTGVISLAESAVQSSQDLLTDRISRMETLLARRRERLLAQFQATESLIASLQSQQTALAGLSFLGTA